MIAEKIREINDEKNETFSVGPMHFAVRSG
jgi:hypothetical protein